MEKLLNKGHSVPAHNKEISRSGDSGQTPLQSIPPKKLDQIWEVVDSPLEYRG